MTRKTDAFAEEVDKMQNCNNRKMRKFGSRDENGVSKQSIVSAMDRFVNAVDNMNETVMVPSRLMDMSLMNNSTGHGLSHGSIDDNDRRSNGVTSSSSLSSPSDGTGTDLFAFYGMLNAAKNELIWGLGSRAHNNGNGTTGSKTGSLPACCSLTSMSSLGSSTTTTTTHSLPPTINYPRTRRTSIVSSMSLSDSEADTESLSESDSGLEYDERSSNAATNFRHHLNGLYQALQQLTNAADILTGRYQDEVGGAS